MMRVKVHERGIFFGVSGMLRKAAVLIVAGSMGIGVLFCQSRHALAEEKKPQTPMGKAMVQIDEGMKKLRRSLRSKDNNPQSLETIAKVEEAALECKSMTPSRHDHALGPTAGLSHRFSQADGSTADQHVQHGNGRFRWRQCEGSGDLQTVEAAGGGRPRSVHALRQRRGEVVRNVSAGDDRRIRFLHRLAVVPKGHAFHGVYAGFRVSGFSRCNGTAGFFLPEP